MAQEKKQSKPVTLYSPKGARVSVSEEKADRFQAIGYRKTKPKTAAKTAAKPAEVDVDALRAEIRAELEAEQAEAVKASEKK